MFGRCTASILIAALALDIALATEGRRYVFVSPFVFFDQKVGSHCVRLVDMETGRWATNKSVCTEKPLSSPISCTFDGYENFTILDHSNAWYRVDVQSMAHVTSKDAKSSGWVSIRVGYDGSTIGIFQKAGEYYPAKVSVDASVSILDVWQSFSASRKILTRGFSASMTSDALFVPIMAGDGHCGSLITLSSLRRASKLALDNEENDDAPCALPALAADNNGNVFAISIAAEPLVHPGLEALDQNPDQSFKLRRVCSISEAPSWWLDGMHGNFAFFVPSKQGHADKTIAFVGLRGHGRGWGHRVIVTVNVDTCRITSVDLPEEVGVAGHGEWCMGDRGAWLDAHSGRFAYQSQPLMPSGGIPMKEGRSPSWSFPAVMSCLVGVACCVFLLAYCLGKDLKGEAVSQVDDPDACDRHGRPQEPHPTTLGGVE